MGSSIKEGQRHGGSGGIGGVGGAAEMREEHKGDLSIVHNIAHLHVLNLKRSKMSSTLDGKILCISVDPPGSYFVLACLHT